MRLSQFVAGAVAATLVCAPLANFASAETTGVSARAAARFEALRAREFPFAGYANPRQTVNIAVHLPLRNLNEAEDLAAAMATPKSPSFRKFLTHAQFMERFAPSGNDMRAAIATLRSGGFKIRKTEGQFIFASAPAVAVNSFFGTRLGLVRDGNRLRIDAKGPVTMPAPLVKIGATVIGLNAMPKPMPDHAVGRREVRPMRPNASHNLMNPQAIFGPLGPYFPGELNQAYGEPSYTYANGAGETVAIVGYADSSDADNQGLWCYYGLGPSCAFGQTLAPYPTVVHIEEPGSDPPDNDLTYGIEAALDAQMVGGTAPGAIIHQYADTPDDYDDFFIELYSSIVNETFENITTTST